jgi:uncharacterized protein
MSTTDTSGPDTTISQRIAVVDGLRGFALFGILITNVIVVSSLLTVVDDGDRLRPLFDGTADHVVGAVVGGFFLGKFYLLFSFLFGYSFTLQLESAARAGKPAVPRLLRRCGMLFAIGLLHALFLWFGDILTLYAVLCLVLIALRRVRPKAAFITGCAIYLGFTALLLVPGEAESDGDLLAFLDFDWLHHAYTGTPMDTLAAQLSIAPTFITFIWLGQGVTALGLFLIGMAAGKRRMLQDQAVLSQWVPRVLWLGTAVGAPVVVASLVGELAGVEFPAYFEAIVTATNPIVMAVYIAAVIRLSWSRRGAALVRILAPAGRMAATNYIAQSAVFAVIYTGYGFALLDRVPPLGAVMIALATFAAQLLASKWWLERHVYGPVEWLLRSATNLAVPAWRRT